MNTTHLNTTPAIGLPILNYQKDNFCSTCGRENRNYNYCPGCGKCYNSFSFGGLAPITKAFPNTSPFTNGGSIQLSEMTATCANTAAKGEWEDGHIA